MQKICLIEKMELTPEALAEIIGAIVMGDKDLKIRGFAKIEEAREGDLSFIANPKYARYIYSTGASAVLVGKDFEYEGEISPTLLIVDDPYSALAKLMRLIESVKPRPQGKEEPIYVSQEVSLPEKCYIGAFTYIGKNAVIGENTLIYPQVYIGENVEIGEGSILYAGVKIYEGCKIGKNCIIHSGAVIGSDGFGFAPENGRYEKIPQTGKVIIEDNVEIGANTTIDRATFGETKIGKGTKLDNLIQVAHNVTIGENNVFASQTGIAGSVKIGSGNRVGGQCGFAGHITIGDNNEFGAQSGIPKSIGDNNSLMGYPAVEARQFAKNQVLIKRLGEFLKEQQNNKKK